jgi:hypothetical protein
MSEDKFGRLLVEMPKIAEATNAFKSEEVQRSAFEALMRALAVGDRAAEDNVARAAGSESDGQDATSEPAAATGATEDRRNGRHSAASPRAQGGRTRRAPTRKSYSAVKDINFRPQDRWPSVISQSRRHRAASARRTC